MNTHNTTETDIDDFDKYANAYFDDLKSHIEMLETELSITTDSEHRDALHDRIAYLKDRATMGDKWVDNDTTASPDAWRTLETYTDAEARAQYKIWDE